MGQWAIGELARLTGTTSRTLRYYGEIGLLPAARTGGGGQRYYDQDGLVRLQRILLLRELGMGLQEIGGVLDGEQDPVAALRGHLELLDRRQERLARQRAAVRTTIDRLERGEELVAREVLDGFDHTRYREEVQRRWGETAYADADRWWRSLDEAGKQEFQQRGRDIAAGFHAAREEGEHPGGQRAQDLADRLCAWVATGWGGKVPSREAFAGLGQLYVDDPRYGMGEGAGAEFVRDAMACYAERNL